MGLYLSKVVTVFVLPLGLGVLLALLAWLLWRARRVARTLLAAAVGVLWLSSTPWVANVLAGWWEAEHPPVPVAEVPAGDVIVVLGGALTLTVHGESELNDASDRYLHAARLFRAGKAPRVLLSGGRLPWLGEGGPEAGGAAGLLERWGVPASALLLDGESRNTRENAVNSAALLAAGGYARVLLVTSAFHMARALGAFRAVGIEAVPVPTDYRTARRAEMGALGWLPDADSLVLTSLLVKEWVGTVVYRWRGWMV